ncbi:MAG: DUF2934 domain-containing protein [Opitutae bacterium]|nr:DUF2934 domain-containing protein [Opitutae bacterium]
MKNPARHVELEGPRFEEAIRREAYCLWKLEGGPDGRDLDHWHRAKEIIQRRVDEDLGPLPEVPRVVLDVKTADEARPASGTPLPAAATAGEQLQRLRGSAHTN